MSTPTHSDTSQAATGPVQPQDVGRRKEKGRSALRSLLQLVLLVLTQQSITMVDVGAASSAVFKATTAAVGVLLLPQAAPAQVVDDRIIMPLSIRLSESSKVAEYVNIRFRERPEGDVDITLTPSLPHELQLSETRKTYYLHEEWPRGIGSHVGNHVGFPILATNNSRTGKNPEVILTFTFNRGGYNNLTKTVRVTVVDDDEANLVVSPDSLRIREGSTSSYVLSLSKRPTNNVTVNINRPAVSDVSVDPSSVTLTPDRWKDHRISVRTVHDNDAVDDRVTLTHSVSGGGVVNSASGSPVVVTVVDDEPGVRLSKETKVKEGETGTYAVVLHTRPAVNVTVTPGSSSNKNVARVVSTGALTFTPSNWNVAQKVIVTGVEDDLRTGDRSATVGHTVSSGYARVTTAGSVKVIVKDNEIPPGVDVSKTGLTVRKDKSDTYTVKLKTKPTGKVTVTPNRDHTGVVDVSGALTFTTGNWSVAKTVTVTGRKVGKATVSHTVTGANYDGMPVDSVIVTVGGGLPSEPKNLTAKPGNRQVTLTWDAPNDDSITHWEIRYGKVSEDRFYDRGFNVKRSSRTETVTGLENGSKYNFRIRSVNAIGSSQWLEKEPVTPEFGGKLEVKPEEPEVGEDSTGTYTLRLTESPGEGALVLVQLEIDDTKKDKANIVAPSPPQLIFTPSNWEDIRTVIITGLSDSDGDNEIVTVHHRITGPGSVKEKDVEVEVEIIDDDLAPAQPRNLTATPGDKEVTLRWDALDDPSVTDWQVGFRKETESSWLAWQDILPSDDTTRTHTVTGLTNNIEYRFRIRARNAVGYGDESEQKGTPVAPISRNIIVPSTVRVVEGARDAEAGPTETVGPEELSYVVIHLLKRPTGNVFIVATPLSEQLVAHEPTKTFTLDDWNSNTRNVEIPVYALNNDTRGGNVDVDLDILVYDTGGTYNEREIVNVEIVDNDTKKLVVSREDLTIKEGESASYEVSLSQQPTSSVRVTIGDDPSGNDVSLSSPVLTSTPLELIFTTSTWSTRQTVAVATTSDRDGSDDTVTLTHSARGGGYNTNSQSQVLLTVTVKEGGGDSLSGSALTLAEETDHQDAARAAKARAAELAGTSRALLGMASDMLGVRITGAAAIGGGGGDSASLEDQAWGILENLLGSNGEFSTDLDLEQIGERLWSQSFQITAAGGGDAQADGTSSGRKGSWTLWGAGDLRSYRGEPEEHISFNGNLKTGWLGLDYGFNDQWLAGLAVSYSSGESDYSYRKTSGATDGGKLSNEVISFYPYGSVQLSERFRLWGLAGFGFGSQHHQHNEGGDKAEGKLRLQMGVIGFTQQLNDVGALQISLAGDVALARSTTDWPAASGLQDVEVSLSRARLGVDTRFPLGEQATGYVNVKGRLDGGELEMGAAEVLAGLHFDGGRFSGALQGQQVYAFDGSYTESGLSAQLSFRTQPDGSGLAWEIQPSYGYGGGEFALGGEQVSLWSDEQLEELTGHSSRDGQMELSSRMGYGIRLSDGERLLTPFTELRLGAGGSRSVGLGLSLSTPSWEVELSGTSEGGSGRAATGKVDLTFSKKL